MNSDPDMNLDPDMNQDTDINQGLDKNPDPHMKSDLRNRILYRCVLPGRVH